MSYSPIIEALPESLRQPNRLALIASVAFHGVAFAIFPFLPTASKGINSQRVVNLIDLSPAEQGRVPQSGSSTALNLPSGLPPLGIGSLPPNLPDYRVGQSSPLDPSEAYRLPDLSSSIITVPIPQRNQPSQESSPAPTIARLPSAKDFELPNVPNIPPFDPNKLPLPQVDPANPTVPPGAAPVPFPDAVASKTPSPANPPAAPIPTGPVERWLAQTQQVAPDPKIALQERTVSLPYPLEACKNRLEGNSKVAAFVDPGGKLVALDSTVGGLKLIDSTGSPTLNAVALNPKNYAIAANGQYQRLVFSSEFKYSEEACEPPQPSPAESPKPAPQASPQSMDQLLAEARREHDSKLVLKPVTIPYVYPKAACEDKLKGLASIVTVVKPGGELAEKPQITKSTGHEILDQTAMDTVANHKFAPTSQYQAYISGFGFEPTEKACSGKSTAQSSTESSQKSESKPSSKPAEKTTPSPLPKPPERATPPLPQLESAPASPTPKVIEETPTPSPEPTEETPAPSPEG